MLSTLTKESETRIKAIIQEKYQVASDSPAFTIPPRFELGELALPIAFDLVRKVRGDPLEIAQELALEAHAIPGIGKVAGAGYLKFHLAQKLNLFYHKYHVLSETDADRNTYQLFVVDMVRCQLIKAPDLPGCEVPSMM